MSMNSMDTPTPGIVLNHDLQGPELRKTIKLVNGLIALRVIRPPYIGVEIVNNFPLFLNPKPSQPEGFRTLANRKTRGQYEVCVADPCHMTSSDHVLCYLYTKSGHPYWTYLNIYICS